MNFDRDVAFPNKIRIIDLLNKIANGEEVPKKIKYKNKIYEWKEYDVCYGKIMTKKGWVKEYGYVAEENRTYFYLKHCYQDLNDEVVLEEPKGIPEKICTNRIINTKDILEFEMIQNKINAEYTYAINWILDYLKSKGE